MTRNNASSKLQFIIISLISTLSNQWSVLKCHFNGFKGRVFPLGRLWSPPSGRPTSAEVRHQRRRLHSDLRVRQEVGCGRNPKPVIWLCSKFFPLYLKHLLLSWHCFAQQWKTVSVSCNMCSTYVVTIRHFFRPYILSRTSVKHEVRADGQWPFSSRRVWNMVALNFTLGKWM